ncbi:MAG: MazG family protein, partial [Pseudomonadota bacterium]
MTPSRDISTLLKIMAALRTPNTGCPWDLEQTFTTIAPYTIEEAYEVADAIERDDMEDLRLELGDLLLQSVYHAQIAQESGHFDFGDVVEGITAKMIRRHPHVFGTEDVTAEAFSSRSLEKGTWEKIKQEEKLEAAELRAAKGLPPKPTKASLLDDVPSTLPAMNSALKLQK